MISFSYKCSLVRSQITRVTSDDPDYKALSAVPVSFHMAAPDVTSELKSIRDICIARNTTITQNVAMDITAVKDMGLGLKCKDCNTTDVVVVADRGNIMFCKNCNKDCDAVRLVVMQPKGDDRMRFLQFCILLVFTNLVYALAM